MRLDGIIRLLFEFHGVFFSVTSNGDLPSISGVLYACGDPCSHRKNLNHLTRTSNAEYSGEMSFLGRFEVSAIHTFWSLVARIGMRRVGRSLKRWYSSAYGDSIFYLGHDEAVTSGCIALTIDDGLVRGELANDGEDCSMVKEVCDLLRKHNSSATFFVCTDYTSKELAEVVLQEGHELGNHLREDRSGFYCNLNENDFRRELDETNKMLQDVLAGAGEDSPGIRWFRAPQGIMTKAMANVLRERNMTNVMGDCYCDDWAFAEKIGATKGKVAPLMLRQVQAGSIAIFHMPQRGFRDTTLDALEEFLEGLNQRNLRCVRVTDLINIQSSTPDGN